MKPTTDVDLANHMVEDLYRQIEPIMRGKAKAVVLLTLIRVVATMLARTDGDTRDKIIDAIPVTLRGTLAMFDEQHPRANGAAKPRTPPVRPS
jgi:hypothetical protein